MSASTKPTLTKPQQDEYDRLMLRSAMASLFWAVIADRKGRCGYRLQDLADALGMDKSGVSRWFSGNDPNWTLNTIADIAGALNVDLRVEAVDRDTGMAYTPQGRRPGLGQPEVPSLLEVAEEPAPFLFQPPTAPKKSVKPRQSGQGRNGGRSRARDPAKARSHKGSSRP